jgi:hypothetical protein
VMFDVPYQLGCFSDNTHTQASRSYSVKIMCPLRQN